MHQKDITKTSSGLPKAPFFCVFRGAHYHTKNRYFRQQLMLALESDLRFKVIKIVSGVI
jgi:hypothetical protein